MLTVDDIRQETKRTLEGEMSLNDLEMWLASNFWNIHLTGDWEADDLLSSIEIWLWDYHNQVLTKQQLWNMLHQTTDAHPIPAR